MRALKTEKKPYPDLIYLFQPSCKDDMALGYGRRELVFHIIIDIGTGGHVSEEKRNIFNPAPWAFDNEEH